MGIYSVQQTLFDCMSFMREFGEDGRSWQIAILGDNFVTHTREADETGCVWLCRQMVSVRAAQTVSDLMSRRFQVKALGRTGPITLRVHLFFLNHAEMLDRQKFIRHGREQGSYNPDLDHREKG